MSSPSSLQAVFFALGGNLLIAIIKFFVAFFTNSSAMLAEGIHSTADSINQVFLLIGSKRSKKKETEEHSFGYGKEEYFWGFMVAILLFTGGAVFSVYEGYHKLLAPEPLKNVWWIFGVLTVSILIETKSYLVAYKEFKKIRSDKSFFKSIRNLNDTNILVIILEDLAALTGLIIVLISSILAYFFDPLFDAVGSIFVGILLAYVSYTMTRELKNLLVGESISREVRAEIKRIIETDTIVKHINDINSMMIGRGEFLLNISIDVKDGTLGYDIEDHIEKIKLKIIDKHPQAKSIFIEIKDAVRNTRV
ncbi:MAG: cation diffusion facilitator family transporter [Bacteroidota bacterium]